MDSKVKSQGFGFAIYPSVKLKGYKKNKKGEITFGFLKELLFGDYLKVFKNGDGSVVKKEINAREYIKVRARNKTGFILPKEVQPNRILEVNFVDIGQGDGCHLVTPNDEHYIIDAGKDDNMFRFLAWRFNLRYGNTNPPKFTAIISHSDEDHYGGFNKLFTYQKNYKQLLRFEKVFHNGMIEESGSHYNTLGKIVADDQGIEYVTGLCDTHESFQERLKNAKKPGRYLKLLEKVNAPIESLKLDDGIIYNEDGLKIEVLGPVARQVQGKDALPVLDSNKGRTKNGHSIVLKLSIGNLRLLLGGDLNSTSEAYLFNCFTGSDIPILKAIIKDPDSKKEDVDRSRDEIEEAIQKMRKDFEVDIAKSCHHGSADFTNEFMRAINPLATIISSGDSESHCHPRPETLGAIGKFSRGERPLIFSTELARSSREFIDTTRLSTYKKKERLVTVYGMINVRTDGNKTIIAQKLEEPRGSANWDINKLVWDSSGGEFKYVN